VIALNRSQVGLWRMRRDIHALCRRLRPAIVHTRNLSGLDALMPARLAGVRRTVHGEHGWDVDDLKGEARRPALLRRLHAPLIRRYITVSKDLERYLVRRIGVAPARITQIYNGVDTARFAPEPSAAAKSCRRLRAAGAVVIGTVGRIQQVKDHATLLGLSRRWRPPTRPSPPARGSPSSATARSSATSDCSPTRSASRISCGSPATGPTSADVLRAFDVFALPSLNEGISNTILEAMASGCPSWRRPSAATWSSSTTA
jgi:glycosyltransferase involved in cell wall biosynthesis